MNSYRRMLVLAVVIVLLALGAVGVSMSAATAPFDSDSSANFHQVASGSQPPAGSIDNGSQDVRCPGTKPCGP